MKISDEMFWSLTLAEYHALKKQYEAGTIEQLHGPAMICSVLANINRDPKKRKQPFTATDFLPVTGSSQRKPSKAQSPQQMVDQLKAIQAELKLASQPTAAPRRKQSK